MDQVQWNNDSSVLQQEITQLEKQYQQLIQSQQRANKVYQQFSEQEKSIISKYFNNEQDQNLIFENLDKIDSELLKQQVQEEEIQIETLESIQKLQQLMKLNINQIDKDVLKQIAKEKERLQIHKNSKFYISIEEHLSDIESKIFQKLQDEFFEKYIQINKSQNLIQVGNLEEVSNLIQYLNHQFNKKQLFYFICQKLMRVFFQGNYQINSQDGKVFQLINNRQFSLTDNLKFYLQLIEHLEKHLLVSHDTGPLIQLLEKTFRQQILDYPQNTKIFQQQSIILDQLLIHDRFQQLAKDLCEDSMLKKFQLKFICFKNCLFTIIKDLQDSESQEDKDYSTLSRLVVQTFNDIQQNQLPMIITLSIEQQDEVIELFLGFYQLCLQVITYFEYKNFQYYQTILVICNELTRNIILLKEQLFKNQNNNYEDYQKLCQKLEGIYESILLFESNISQQQQKLI